MHNPTTQARTMVIDVSVTSFPSNLLRASAMSHRAAEQEYQAVHDC